MNIILVADGNDCTKKALDVLVTHESLAGAEDELVVPSVRLQLPPRVSAVPKR